MGGVAEPVPGNAFRRQQFQLKQTSANLSLHVVRELLQLPNKMVQRNTLVHFCRPLWGI